MGKWKEGWEGEKEGGEGKEEKGREGVPECANREWASIGKMRCAIGQFIIRAAVKWTVCYMLHEIEIIPEISTDKCLADFTACLL